MAGFQATSHGLKLSVSDYTKSGYDYVVVWIDGHCCDLSIKQMRSLSKWLVETADKCEHNKRENKKRYLKTKCYREQGF